MAEENKSYYLPFPTRLRQLMDDAGASQQALADYVGVMRQAVAQWKDGKTIPDMYNFKRIAEFFKIPYELLTARCMRTWRWLAAWVYLTTP